MNLSPEERRARQLFIYVFLLVILGVLGLMVYSMIALMSGRSTYITNEFGLKEATFIIIGGVAFLGTARLPFMQEHLKRNAFIIALLWLVLAMNFASYHSWVYMVATLIFGGAIGSIALTLPSRKE